MRCLAKTFAMEEVNLASYDSIKAATSTIYAAGVPEGRTTASALRFM